LSGALYLWCDIIVVVALLFLKEMVVYPVFQRCQELFDEALARGSVFSEEYWAYFIVGDECFRLIKQSADEFLLTYDMNNSAPQVVHWNVRRDGLYQPPPIIWPPRAYTEAERLRPSTKVSDDLVQLEFFNNAAPVPRDGMYGYVHDGIITSICPTTIWCIRANEAPVGTPVFVLAGTESFFALSPNKHFIDIVRFWQDFDAGRIVNIDSLIQRPTNYVVMYPLRGVITVSDGTEWIGRPGPVNYLFIGPCEDVDEFELAIDLRTNQYVHD